MGFNRGKLEDQRRDAAEKEAANRRATDAQVLEDAERLIAAWNERQAKRMPMLFSPTIGAAITAGYWFLRVHCPACRTIKAIDLRDAAVSSLNSRAVVPVMPTEHRRRNAGRTSSSHAGRMTSEPVRRLASSGGRVSAPGCCPERKPMPVPPSSRAPTTALTPHP